MKMLRAALALSLLIAASGIASAGPINWSYTSSGATDGQYHVDGASISWSTPPGQTQNIYLIGGYTYPNFYGTNVPPGETLWTAVTILDADSGQSGTFNVPIQFLDLEPTQVSGMYGYIPHLGPIASVDLVLGEHEYIITNGPDRALAVRVETTPEPATFALIGFGCTGVMLTRLRRGLR